MGNLVCKRSFVKGQVVTNGNEDVEQIPRSRSISAFFLSSLSLPPVSGLVLPLTVMSGCLFALSFVPLPRHRSIAAHLPLAIAQTDLANQPENPDAKISHLYLKCVARQVNSI